MSDIIWEMSDDDEFTTLEILEGRDLNREMEEHAAMIDARIAALEAKNAAIHSRLEFTSCQKADVEAQVLELEEQNAALREDAAVGRAIVRAYKEKGGISIILTHNKDGVEGVWLGLCCDDFDNYESICEQTLYAALAAAGLMEEEGK